MFVSTYSGSHFLLMAFLALFGAPAWAPGKALVKPRLLRVDDGGSLAMSDATVAGLLGVGRALGSSTWAEWVASASGGEGRSEMTLGRSEMTLGGTEESGDEGGLAPSPVAEAMASNEPLLR